MAPIEKIRLALGPAQAAAFERAFAAFADRIVEIKTKADSAAPSLTPHFHGGNLVKIHHDRDEVFR